jgi:D-3-phosphoglycerate dehydrogenase / 2-oxoglutarate reductase
MTLLVTARFDEAELARLEAAAGPAGRAGYGVTGRRLEPAELALLVADVELLVVEYEEVTEAVLAAAPRLRLLGCCRNEPAASVDVDAASAFGIPVLFTPGRNAVSVAEYTLGLMLAVSRRIAEAHHLLRYTAELTGADDAEHEVVSEWSLEPDAPFARLAGPELSGRTLGLVGLGAIGRELARRCIALGMEVVAFDPYAGPEAGVRRAGLLETAAEADFLVLAAGVTPESAGIVSADVLAAMKPSAFFVNTGRAALADYDALVQALRTRRIAGAALDVYPLEPLPPDSPLLELDNVVLSPHLAGASLDVPRHHSRQLTDDLLRALSGERPLHLADPSVWERRR